MVTNALGFVALPLLWVWAWTFYLSPRWLREIQISLGSRILNRLAPREKVVRGNIEIAYGPKKSAEEKEELIQGHYRHLSRLFHEILLLFGPLRRFTEKEALLEGWEHWEAAKLQGKGVVMLASHVGNWEVMVARGGVSGMDLLMVTKHLKPEWLHQAIEKGRARCGVRATYEPRTFRDVLKHLKENGTVGFVLDQYAGPPVGVRVPVFGVPVGTQSAVALLVKRTGAIVLPVVNYFDPGRGRRIVRIEAPLSWDGSGPEDEEIARNTARYAQALEKHITAHPAEWLWIHRRFKGDLGPLKPGEWKEGRMRR